MPARTACKERYYGFERRSLCRSNHPWKIAITITESIKTTDTKPIVDEASPKPL